MPSKKTLKKRKTRMNKQKKRRKNVSQRNKKRLSQNSMYENILDFYKEQRPINMKKKTEKELFIKELNKSKTRKDKKTLALKTIRNKLCSCKGKLTNESYSNSSAYAICIHSVLSRKKLKPINISCDAKKRKTKKNIFKIKKIGRK